MNQSPEPSNKFCPICAVIGLKPQPAQYAKAALNLDGLINQYPKQLNQLTQLMVCKPCAAYIASQIERLGQ